MADQLPSSDRQSAVALQKTLETWGQLRVASQTGIHVLARFEPADAQTLQARDIIAALQAHGRAAARFVAGQTGSSESGAILWWIESQLADDFSRDNESAGRFNDVHLGSGSSDRLASVPRHLAMALGSRCDMGRVAAKSEASRGFEPSTRWVRPSCYPSPLPIHNPLWTGIEGDPMRHRHVRRHATARRGTTR